MKLSKRIRRSLSRFFFPPPGSPRWIRALPYAVLGVLTLMLLTGSAYAWDYTNSPPFCGETCHTMPPEYTAYLTSPHSRIDCVDCHIGKGFITTRITRKAGDARHILSLAFRDYEFPIRAKEMRPARETCELCHSPQKFSDDSLRVIKHYGDDPQNSLTRIYLVMHTGGGSQREGLGRGIHWHIENKVFYLPSDPEEQEIPYIRVENADGSINEYVDIEAGSVVGQTVDQSQLREMDCITCHNRITHVILTPEEAVDTLMERGVISPDIPDIHRLATEIYGREYNSLEEGLNALSGITAYYETYYSDYYKKNQATVDKAVAALVESYRQSVFPEQKADWKSHPNNIGHTNSAGCFRCHDGKHLDRDNKAIRLECNLCHAIPVVSTSEDLVAEIEISRGPEPQTHLHANWISMHNQVFDATCESCHTTADPGGSSNTSFCSNSACHGSVLSYAGIDAPALRETILSQLPPTPTPVAVPLSGKPSFSNSIGELFEARCGQCHGDTGIEGLTLTDYTSALAGGNNGAVIVPGDPDASLLIAKQSGDQPHFGQLSAGELEVVKTWIANGAPE